MWPKILLILTDYASIITKQFFCEIGMNKKPRKFRNSSKNIHLYSWTKMLKNLANIINLYIPNYQAIVYNN